MIFLRVALEKKKDEESCNEVSIEIIFIIREPGFIEKRESKSLIKNNLDN